MGARLATAGDERYAALRAELLDGAIAGHDARQRVDFVHALGNTGDASLSPQIVPMLGDAAPAVRAAAAHSLGALGTDPVAEALLARLRQEPVDVVRGAIATALTTWSAPTPTAMTALRATLPGEREESTRLAMVQILGRNLATYPENRAALQSLLRTESSERIRRELAQMLAPGR